MGVLRFDKLSARWLSLSKPEDWMDATQLYRLDKAIATHSRRREAGMEQARAAVARRAGLYVRGFLLVLTGFAVTAVALHAQTEGGRISIGIGHSQVIQYAQPVGRVSIANPEIADATVATPNQVLVNGKSVGSTNLVVWDEQDRYTRYEVTVRPAVSTDQIMLGVRFAEVKRTALLELGTDFIVRNRVINSETVSAGSFAGKVSTPSNPLLFSENVDLFLSIPTQNFEAIIHALEEKNILTMLAKPNLSAINGTEASFLAGGEFPVPIVSGSAGLQTVTIVFKEFGVRLKFTPTIMDSSIVNIKVNTEVSTLDFENGITLSGFRIPALMTRRAETSVEMREGQYFILGGLISQDVGKTISRIPLLGQIPVLGLLFSSEQFRNNDTELIIMITPKIVHAQDHAPIQDLEQK